MTHMDGKGMNILEENVKRLKELFPEIVTEGKVDFDTLRQVLGDYVEEDKEAYSFTWSGKGKALRHSQTPSTGTLRPAKKESKDWDTTQNLYIEGDNLEVLKLLQKSYFGRIKMIYIDPPYNTGKDFVYEDDFRDSIKNYKELTGQVDGAGRALSTNPETSGRYHRDWLNMMYPRLRLARNLLTEDGVIFISIDDVEQANLRVLCNEVFGEQNFIGTTVRASSPSQNVGKHMSIMHDYALVYLKDIDSSQGGWSVKKNNAGEFELRAKRLLSQGLTSDEIRTELRALTKYPRFYDFDHYVECDESGVHQHVSMGGVKSGNTETQILHPITKKAVNMPLGGWRYKEEELLRLVANNEVYFGDDDTVIPRRKLYLHDYLTQLPKGISFFDTQEDVQFLQDEGIPFDFPKPTRYLMYFCEMINDSSSIVLDFFSGSATTAHAVMQLNAEDGGKRKFIMVQLPEPTDKNSEAFKAGYSTISDIGKERIRRAGELVKKQAIKAWNEADIEQRQQMKNPDELDIGFKVFKLDSSNLIKWNPDRENIEASLLGYVDNLEPGRTEEDLLYEVMLKLGADLTWPIETHKVGTQTIYSVGFGALMVCLSDHITTEVADAMVRLKDEMKPETWKVVFKDSGFADDMAKTNIKETLKCAGLPEDAFTTL